MPFASSSSDQQGGLSLIVEEVLGAVFAPSRRAEAVAEALEVAGLDAIPDRPTSIRIFVEGALFTTLARHLDVPSALELVGQIRASLDLALNMVDEERVNSDIRERMPPGAVPRRVLVVTQASLVVFLLQDVLGEEVEVMPVGDPATLEDRLRRLAGQPLLVVVDRKHPCAGPGICEILLREMGPDGTVIWWGASAPESESVAASLRGGPLLVPCAFDLQLADLGDVCRSLLGA